MKEKERKIFYSSIQVREMFSNEQVKDIKLLKEKVFNRFEQSYREAERTGNFTSFQKRFQKENEVLTVSCLNYHGDFLCGMIGRCTPKIDRLLRERNPDTFEENELVPNVGNLFEEYSYFVISCSQMQMAYLPNPAVSTNIPQVVVYILRRNLGDAPYNFEETKLLDYDIKKKLRELKGTKVMVKGTIIGQEQSVTTGIPSLKKIEKALGSKMKARISVSAHLSRSLTDADIDMITENACADDGFSSFTFSDEMDADKEIIDVIRRQTYLTTKIKLAATELQQPEIVWKKMCCSFKK